MVKKNIILICSFMGLGPLLTPLVLDKGAMLGLRPGLKTLFNTIIFSCIGQAG